MNEPTLIPSINFLKHRRSGLRADLMNDGVHSGGAQPVRWNCWRISMVIATGTPLHARAGNQPARSPVAPGDRVAGHYLGQSFDGMVTGVEHTVTAGRYRVSIRFDDPVDVVTFSSFSNLRQRVRVCHRRQGRDHGENLQRATATYASALGTPPHAAGAGLAPLRWRCDSYRLWCIENGGSNRHGGKSCGKRCGHHRVNRRYRACLCEGAGEGRLRRHVERAGRGRRKLKRPARTWNPNSVYRCFTMVPTCAIRIRWLP